MDTRLINIGYGNFISAGRIISIVGPDSAPVKRLLQEAKEERRVIDATCGRKTCSVIIADSDHIILSALQSETIARRFEGKGSADSTAEEEN